MNVTKRAVGNCVQDDAINGLSVTVMHLQILKMTLSISAVISTKKNELKVIVAMNPHHSVNFRKCKGNFIAHA